MFIKAFKKMNKILNKNLKKMKRMMKKRMKMKMRIKMRNRNRMMERNKVIRSSSIINLETSRMKMIIMNIRMKMSIMIKWREIWKIIVISKNSNNK
jgi:hypothetical protein